jgi:hypothetical protein
VNYQRRTLAIHEAGHAVVALEYKLEPAIRSKVIAGVRKGFAAGTTYNCPETVGQKFQLLVSGAAACHVFEAAPCIKGADDDFVKFSALCRECKIKAPLHAAYAIGAFSAAVRIIENRRDLALAIADAFFERGELSCEEIRSIVAKGTTK